MFSAVLSSSEHAGQNHRPVLVLWAGDSAGGHLRQRPSVSSQLSDPKTVDNEPQLFLNTPTMKNCVYFICYQEPCCITTFRPKHTLRAHPFRDGGVTQSLKVQIGRYEVNHPERWKTWKDIFWSRLTLPPPLFFNTAGHFNLIKNKRQVLKACQCCATLRHMLYSNVLN